jgi:hypothetical protein
VEDSRCLLFAHFSSSRNFFHFVSLSSLFHLARLSHGVAGSPRPPGMLSHSLFLRTTFVTDSEYCRASRPLDLISGPRYLRYYPLHERLCATLAVVIRSCRERRTHRTSSPQTYKNGLLRVVTAWSCQSAWNPFLWLPFASALRGLQWAIHY